LSLALLYAKHSKHLKSQRFEEKAVARVVVPSKNEAKIISIKSWEMIEKIGGDDGVRTRDLRRDRPAF
jgi:hypothetical protein